MKKLNFIVGIICVIVGLLMFFISVPFAIVLILAGALNIFLYYKAKNKQAAAPDTKSAEATPAEICQTITYECADFQVAGFDFYQNELRELLEDESYEYTLSPRDFKEEVFGRCYEYEIEYHDAEIVPEPENEHDPNALAVMVDGMRIGYVGRRDQAKVKALDPERIEVEVYGGRYKEVNEDDKIVTGKTPYKATLHFYIKKV